MRASGAEQEEDWEEGYKEGEAVEPDQTHALDAAVGCHTEPSIARTRARTRSNLSRNTRLDNNAIINAKMNMPVNETIIPELPRLTTEFPTSIEFLLPRRLSPRDYEEDGDVNWGGSEYSRSVVNVPGTCLNTSDANV